MIVLDSDIVTLLSYGNKRLESKVEQCDDPIAVTVITRMEISKDQTGHTQKKGINRNAPCPCGSGKKYKVCCKRKSQ